MSKGAQDYDREIYKDSWLELVWKLRVDCFKLAKGDKNIQDDTDDHQKSLSQFMYCSLDQWD